MELNSKWMKFCDGLKHIDDLCLSRHVIKHNRTNCFQIQPFANASERAYEAAVYIRSITQDDRSMICLLCAKSRIAPLERKNPLIGAICSLASSTGKFTIKRELNFNKVLTYFQSDSEMVLTLGSAESIRPQFCPGPLPQRGRQ